MRAHGETDMKKLVVTVCTFANAPENSFCLDSWNLRPVVPAVYMDIKRNNNQ
jgi:hypothetical protein